MNVRYPAVTAQENRLRHRRLGRWALAGVLGGLVLSAASELAAQTVIPVENASFEVPTPSTFPDYTVGATGWTRTRNDIDAGTFEPGGGSGVTPAPIDGAQVGYANGSGGLQQVLSTGLVQGSTYTFSVYFGNRSDSIETLSNGTIEFGTFDGTFHLLASESAAPAQGNFAHASGSYVQATAPDPSQTIAIRLINTGNVQVVFDQVQLSMTAIPEPASVGAVLGAAALLGAGLWRRKRPRAQST